MGKRLKRKMLVPPKFFDWALINFLNSERTMIIYDRHSKLNLITVQTYFKRYIEYFIEPNTLTIWLKVDPYHDDGCSYHTKHKLKLKEVKNVDAPTKEI